ncbi:RecB-family nuclease [Caldivirga sp.]|uniref:RecB-family nuclease n=1 Tax=Caldivirga sp. TaxID=2080243 RepID=UPI003D0E481E
MRELIVLIDNVSSVARAVEFAKVVYGFGIKNLVLTHVYGSAAQQGVPEAFKIALRYSSSLIVLPTIKDAVDLFKPDNILIIRRIGPQVKPLAEFISISGRIMLAVDGSDQDIRIEGNNINYITPITHDIGSLGQLTIALCFLMSKCTLST